MFGGTVTVKVNPVLCAMLPSVPTIEMIYDPTGVATLVWIVKVLVQVGLHEVGEKTPVAPAGSPDTEKETVLLVPDNSVVVIIFDPLVPWTTEIVPEFEIEKSKPGTDCVVADALADCRETFPAASKAATV